MAARDITTFQYEPRWPVFADIDASRVVIRYDDVTDTLLVNLDGTARPAISVVVDEHAYVRVDPETNDVLGFQIEEFLSTVVIEKPQLLVLAELAGIDRRTIDQVARRIAPARAKEAAIRTLFGQHFPVTP